MEHTSSYGLIQRLKALHDLLREGEFSRPEILRLLPQYYKPDSSGTRRLVRDIKALREWGYTITIDHAKHTYKLEPIPFISLSDENVQALALIRETFATLTPISLDVLSLLEKIDAALPETQRSLYADQPPLAIHIKPAADYRSALGNIRLLESAIVQDRKVRFAYPALDDGQMVTHVGVEPYQVQFFEQHFYLLGFTPHAPEMFEFRIDRIQGLEMMSGKTSKHRKRRLTPFTYRLSEQVARHGVSERFSNQQVTLQSDGSAMIQAEGYSDFRIIQELLRYGEQAELMGPQELRKHISEVVQAMSALYKTEKDK